jgi:hypothetical protein
MLMVMLVVMPVAAAIAILVMLMVMLVMMPVATAVAVLVMLMMVVLMVLMRPGFGNKLGKRLIERAFFLDRGEDRFSRNLRPRRRNQRRVRIQRSDDRKAVGKLRLACPLGMRKNNGSRMRDLITEELSEVLHIHLAFVGIDNRNKSAKDSILGFDVLYGADDIAELSDAGRLDEDAIRSVLSQHRCKRAAEISDKTAADTAGVHLSHLNTCLAHKAAVDSDLAKLIFNQNQLFSAIRFADQLFDKGRFPGTEKSRKNIDLCHTHIASFSFLCSVYTGSLQKYYIPKQTVCQQRSAPKNAAALPILSVFSHLVLTFFK